MNEHAEPLVMGGDQLNEEGEPITQRKVKILVVDCDEINFLTMRQLLDLPHFKSLVGSRTFEKSTKVALASVLESM